MPHERIVYFTHERTDGRTDGRTDVCLFVFIIIGLLNKYIFYGKIMVMLFRVRVGTNHPRWDHPHHPPHRQEGKEEEEEAVQPPLDVRISHHGYPSVKSM